MTCRLPIRYLACGCEIEPQDGAYVLVPKCRAHNPGMPARVPVDEAASGCGTRPNTYIPWEGK